MITEPAYATTGPDTGPVARAAVLRSPTRRPNDVAAHLTDMLRAAGCMAIEADAARLGIDPFDDVYRQWQNVADRNAYDLVFSVGGLLPAAVALGVVAQLPVVVLHRAPATDRLAPLLAGDHGPVDRRPVTVLEATVNRVRRITTAPIEVSADTPFTADCDAGGHRTDLRATRLRITGAGSAPSPLTVTADDQDPRPGDRSEVAEQRGVVLRVGIDDRWCLTRSVAVRALPDPLTVVEPDTPTG